MSLRKILQTPFVIVMLAIVAIGLLVLLRADVLLGVIVVVPFMVCVWLVRNHHLTLLRQAIQDDMRKRKTVIIQNQNKEL